MAKLGELVVDFKAETASFVRETRRVRQEVSVIGRSLEDLKRQARDLVGGFLAWETIKRGVEAVVEAITEAEQAQGRLQGVLRATGQAAGLTAEDLSELADQMAGKTLFDDDEFRKAEAALLTFRSVQGDTFKRAIGDAADLSAVFGQDLTASAVMLGKALEDPTQGLTALRRVGVMFTAAEREQIQAALKHNDTLKAQQLILAGVERQVSGTAAAMKTGLSGSIDEAKKALDDFMKSARDSYLVDILSAGLHRLADAYRDVTLSANEKDFIQLDDLQTQAETAKRTLERFGYDVRALEKEAEMQSAYVPQSIAGRSIVQQAYLEYERLQTSAHQLEAQIKRREQKVADDREAAARAARAAAEEARAEAARQAAEAIAAAKQSDLNQMAARYRDELAQLTLTTAGYTEYLLANAGAKKTSADATAEEVRQLMALVAAMKSQKAYLDQTTASIRSQERALAKRANALLPYNAERFKAEAEALKAYYAQLLEQQSKLEDGPTAYQEAWKRAAQNVQDVVAGSLEELFTGQISTVRAFFAMVLRDLAKVAAQMAALGLVQAGIGLVGDLLIGGGLTGMKAHTGGVVGADLVGHQAMPAGLFTGAPRLHAGMLAADEFPTILQKGESVLTPAQLAAVMQLGGRRSGGGGPKVIVQQTHNHYYQAIDTAGMEALIERHGPSIARQSLRAARESAGYARELVKRGLS